MTILRVGSVTWSMHTHCRKNNPPRAGVVVIDEQDAKENPNTTKRINFQCRVLQQANRLGLPIFIVSTPATVPNAKMRDEKGNVIPEEEIGAQPTNPRLVKAAASHRTHTYIKRDESCFSVKKLTEDTEKLTTLVIMGTMLMSCVEASVSSAIKEGKTVITSPRLIARKRSDDPYPVWAGHRLIKYYAYVGSLWGARGEKDKFHAHEDLDI